MPQIVKMMIYSHTFLSVGGSALQDSAFGYFITACVVVLLAIMSYLTLPRMVRPHIL